METALREKFIQNPHAGKILKETYPSKLVLHTIRDSFWGDGGDGSGLNHLGILLEKIRNQI